MLVQDLLTLGEKTAYAFTEVKFDKPFTSTLHSKTYNAVRKEIEPYVISGAIDLVEYNIPPEGDSMEFWIRVTVIKFHGFLSRQRKQIMTKLMEELSIKSTYDWEESLQKEAALRNRMQKVKCA